MKGWVPRLVAGVVAGVAVYVGFSIWADVGKVGEALRSLSLAVRRARLPAGGRQLRWSGSLRWQYYLRVIGVGDKISAAR